MPLNGKRQPIDWDDEIDEPTQVAHHATCPVLNRPAPSCFQEERSAMKQDAEVLLMLRERAKGRTQAQAAARSGMRVRTVYQQVE